MPITHPNSTKNYSPAFKSPVKQDSTDPAKLGVPMPTVAPNPSVTMGKSVTVQQAQINQANSANDERHRGLNLAKAVVADPYSQLHNSGDVIFKSQQRLKNQQSMVQGVKDAAGTLGVDTSAIAPNPEGK